MKLAQAKRRGDIKDVRHPTPMIFDTQTQDDRSSASATSTSTTLSDSTSGTGASRVGDSKGTSSASSSSSSSSSSQSSGRRGSAVPPTAALPEVSEAEHRPRRLREEDFDDEDRRPADFFAEPLGIFGEKKKEKKAPVEEDVLLGESEELIDEDYYYPDEFASLDEDGNPVDRELEESKKPAYDPSRELISELFGDSYDHLEEDEDRWLVDIPGEFQSVLLLFYLHEMTD